MIEAVVFDMDGVLFDTERIYGVAWHKAAENVEVDNLDYIIKACTGLVESDARRVFNEYSGGKIVYDDYRKVVRETFNKIIKEEGVPLKKGVFEILDYLKENNYKIGLASSTVNETVVSYLKEVKIYDYFDVLITGDMIENGKPEPDIYLKACEKLGVKSENAMAVEDSFNGLKSAYNAKMKAVMVPDLLQPTEEIEKIIYKKFDSLIDFKDYLELANK